MNGFVLKIYLYLKCLLIGVVNLINENLIIKVCPLNSYYQMGLYLRDF